MKRPILKFILAAGAAGAIGAFGVGCDDTTNTGGAGGATASSGSTSTKASSSTGMAADCSKICTTYGAAVPKVASDITDKAAADPAHRNPAGDVRDLAVVGVKAGQDDPGGLG